MGGLEDAIAYAAQKAELADDYRIKEYPIQKPFFEQIVEEITQQTRTRVIEKELGSFKTYYDQIKTVQKMEGVQARLPFIYSIN
jgi:protease-4